MKTVLMGLLISATVFARPPADEEAFKHRGHMGCHQIVNAEQKEEIKLLKKGMKDQIAQLSPALKEAKKALKQAMKNEQTTLEDVLVLKESIKSQTEAIKAIRSTVKLAIQFDILSAKQRVKLFKCQSHMQRDDRLQRRDRRHSRYDRMDRRRSMRSYQHRRHYRSDRRYHQRMNRRNHRHFKGDSELDDLLKFDVLSQEVLEEV